MIALGDVPTLASPRLSLRRPVLADAEAIARLADDWVIAGRDGGEVFGVIGLAPCSDRVEFGYWLGRPHWNHGIATEAGGAVLSYAFGAAALTRVLSGCFDGNGRSSRGLEKLGFAVTGRSNRACLARGRMCRTSTWA